jgi:phosphotransacetylase
MSEPTVLADVGDQRVAEAALVLRDQGLADPIVLGADVNSLSDVDDQAVFETAEQVTAEFEAKGRSVDLGDPLIIGAIVVRSGWAKGCVAGASRPTGDVIRAGIRVLGTAPRVTAVSSCFFVLPGGQPIVCGDCGVRPNRNWWRSQYPAPTPFIN